MALPATGYGTATITNPASALTDFVLMIDLSRMHASWWSAVDTSDGTKGRASKSDDTELSTDWIDFDSGAETGWLRVKYSGTLAASGTQTIKIFPPVAANSSNAASATYGSDNAYDSSWAAYYPLHDLLDRTSNSKDLSNGATAPLSGQAGKLGDCYEFDDANTESLTRADSVIGSTEPFTIAAWARRDSAASPGTIAAIGVDGASMHYARIAYRSDDLRVQATAADSELKDSAAGFTQDAWHHCVGGFDPGGSSFTIENILNKTRLTGSGVLSMPASLDRTTIGVLQYTSLIQYFSGRIDDVQFHTALRSTDWWAEEYDQTDDQATFWGSWGWTAGAGGDLTVSMQPAEATGAALTLTPVPAAITVSMQPAEATGAALTLTPVPAAITVSMQPAEATADAVTLTPVPAAITVSMQPAEATADAVTLTPVPAAITVSMQTVGATGAALSLSVNDGAVSTLKLVVITPVISEIKPEIWDPGINFEHPLTQDLLAHWPMWEQGGDKVKDVSGNRNHFTINGMPRVTSRIGIGLQQSDDGDELTSTTPVVIPGNTDFTYIWRGVIISYSSSLSYLWANTGSDRIAFAAGSGFPAIMINNIWALNPGSGYEVPTGELVTLAFVIKADYWAGFYANGILQHSNFFSRGRPDTLIYTFGWSVVTDRRITGTWVSHSLYNAALTSSAVAQLSTDPDQFTRKSSITLPVIAELSNLIVSMSTTEAIGAAPSLTIKSDLTVSMSTIETIAAAPALTVIPAAVIVSMSIAEAIAAAPTINVGNIVKVTMGTAEAIADSLLLSVGVGATQVSLDIATAIGEAVALNLIPGAVVPLMGTATLTGEALSINVGNIVKVTMGVAEAIGEAHSLIMAPGVVTLPMAVSCAIGAATSLFIRSDETVQMSTAAAIAAAPTFTVQISYGGFYETTNNAIRGQVLDNVETTLGLSVKYPNAPFSNPATKWVELNIDHDETTLVSKGGGSRLRTFGICRLTVWSLLEQGEKSALETIDAMIPSFRIQALSNYPFGSVMMGVPSVGQSSRVDDWFTTELNCPFYCDRIIG